MDCREFRKHHASYLENSMPARQMDEAVGHAMSCQDCARWDTSVRRALLVFRNVATIEPSSDFAMRLNQRLMQVRLGESSLETFDSRFNRVARFSVMGALAATVMIGMAAVMAESNITSATDIVLPPVVASRPDYGSNLVTPTIAVSLSAGMPVWPALLMVERATRQLEEAELYLTSDSY